MILIFYGCLAAGFFVLAAAATGRLRAADRARAVAHGVGIVSAILVVAAPFWAWLQFALPGDPPSPVLVTVAALDFAGATLLILGTMIGRPGASSRLAETGYAVLLAVGAVPSFVLLPMAPAVLLAGACLVQPVSELSPRRT